MPARGRGAPPGHVDSRVELLERDDAVNHPISKASRRRSGPRSPSFEGPGVTDQPRQKEGPPAVGHQADLDEGLAEEGVGRGDDDVGGERVIATDAGGVSVTRAMIGFGKLRIARTPGLMTSRRSVVTSRSRRKAPLADRPRAERIARAGDDDTRVSSSNDSFLIASVKRCIVTKSIELRRAGLLNVTRLTPASR